MDTEQRIELLEGKLKETEIKLNVLMKEYAKHVASQNQGLSEWDILAHLEIL